MFCCIAQAMAGDAGRDAHIAELRRLLKERGIPFEDPGDLERLVKYGYYNAPLLSAATVELLMDPVGLTLALAGLLVKKFGESQAGAHAACCGQSAGAARFGRSESAARSGQARRVEGQGASAAGERARHRRSG